MKYIEEMRTELIQLANRQSLTHPDVVKLSQKLDLLLNEYRARMILIEHTKRKKGRIMMCELKTVL